MDFLTSTPRESCLTGRLHNISYMTAHGTQHWMILSTSVYCYVRSLIYRLLSVPIHTGPYKGHIPVLMSTVSLSFFLSLSFSSFCSVNYHPYIKPRSWDARRDAASCPSSPASGRTATLLSPIRTQSMQEWEGPLGKGVETMCYCSPKSSAACGYPVLNSGKTRTHR